MAVLAIDAGTSVVKAAVFADGTELAGVGVPTPSLRPRPGHREQDMTATWQAVVQAVRSVVRRAGVPVTALATTAQGDGCWLVDERLDPVGPAILWNDGRAASIVSRWQRDGALARGYARNGSAGFAGLLNAILAWLVAHEPDRLTRARAALTCNGWLHAALTGHAAADASDASAPFLDLTTGRYAEDLVELFGVAEHARLLPEILDDPVHPLTARAAGDLGLPPGIPVVMAPYDVPATALGLGVTDIGQAYCVLGTTLCAAAPVAGRPDGGEPAGLTLS
ncbi:MAG: FGGY family carbohydrate kinase, partial [Actinocatenispora sp.]